MIFTPDLCKEIEIERQKWPDLLVKIEVDNDLKSYADRHGVIEVWASKNFRLRIVRHSNGLERISVHRMSVDLKNDTWEGNILWDELQELKSQCGRGERFAFEPFPPDSKLINNGNYRHIWLIDTPEQFKLLMDLINLERKGLSPDFDPSQRDILKGDFQ